MNRFFKSHGLLRTFKFLVDFGMLICLLLVLVIALSGPIDYSLLGIPIRASHLHSPLEKLFILLFVRLAISIELRSFILLIVSVAFSLAMVELVLRIWDAPIARGGFLDIHGASPVFAWDLKPGSAGYGALGEFYEINPVGVRDKVYALAKSPETYRIMIIGDSFTFGMGVDLEATYAKQLEALLASEGHSVEVVNLGVIGHNMWQHFEMLKHKALPYQPDLIVLALFEDDLIVPSRPPEASEAGYQGYNPFSGAKAEKQVSRFYLRNFLRNLEARFEYRYRGYEHDKAYVRSIAERRKFWGPENSGDSNYRIMAGKLDDGFYRRFADALAEFARVAREGGSEVLVVLIPDSVQLNDPTLQVVNRHVENATDVQGLPFLDLTAVLEREDDPGSLYLFPHDAHNSPRGLRLIAESIAGEIKARDMLPEKEGNPK